MKLKQQPDDFYVEELTDVAPGSGGPFAFYRMEKTAWATPDAIGAIGRRWHLNARLISFGGLKDRHAHTVQHLTIHRGPRRELTHDTVRLNYLGQVAEPYTSRHIRANRFRITLREVPPGDIAGARQALDEIRVDGVPNYFDDQRFGSVCGGEEFSARLMILGRYEEALRLALTVPYEHDRAQQKHEKAILLAHWGDWHACQSKFPRGHAPAPVDYLVHQPTGFRGALARLHPELGGLYLSAYQSYLWNKMLARWIAEHCRPEQLLTVRLRLGDMAMHRGLGETQKNEMAAAVLPLPSARLKLDPNHPFAALIESVLAEEGFTLSEMKVKKMRAPFFSKGDRPVLCLPENMSHEAAADERHPGFQKLIMTFDLPRGSYATLIVKRVQAHKKWETGDQP